MKKILLVVLAAITLTSCGKEEKPVKDYLVLSGNIKSFRKSNIELLGHNYKQRIKFDRKSKTFSDTLRNIQQGHYFLKIGKRQVPLYLSDTVDTKLVVDAKKRTQDPVFKGSNSKTNSYLSKKRKKFGLILGNAKKLFALEEESFLAKMEEYKNALLKLAENSKLSEEYLTKEKRNIDYEYLRNLINYQKYHRLLTGDEEFVVSDTYPTNLVKKFDFNNNEDYINSLSFREVLKDNLKDLATKRLPKDGDFTITHIETVQTEITDTLVKNDLLHKIANKDITFTDNLGEFYKKYMAFSTSEKNKKEITELYNKLKLTAKGMPSPKFVDYENYEDGSKVSLDDLIGKGKYLYIDVWATWCSFCKKEIPLLKNFEVKYHGKNIEFVSINVDKKENYSKWKKTVEDKEMGGVQLFAGDTEKNLQFTKDYLVKGLPKFILLDPEGNIVTANAPRPSEGDKLTNLFEKLGIEEH